MDDLTPLSMEFIPRHPALFKPINQYGANAPYLRMNGGNGCDWIGYFWPWLENPLGTLEFIQLEPPHCGRSKGRFKVGGKAGLGAHKMGTTIQNKTGRTTKALDCSIKKWYILHFVYDLGERP